MYCLHQQQETTVQQEHTELFERPSDGEICELGLNIEMPLTLK